MRAKKRIKQPQAKVEAELAARGLTAELVNRVIVAMHQCTNLPAKAPRRITTREGMLAIKRELYYKAIANLLLHKNLRAKLRGEEEMRRLFEVDV
jgi:hypothetical protein